MTDCGYEIKTLWMVADGGDYDEIWDIIFALDNIVPIEDLEPDEEYVDEFGDE